MAYKLAYLCSSMSWGGLEMNQLRNAMWMKRRGLPVCILGLDKSPLIIEAKKNNLNTICIKKHRKYYDFVAAYKLSRIIKKESISHLIIRNTKDLSITSTIKFILGEKIKTAYFMEMQLGVNKKNIFHTLRFKGLDLWSCPLHFLSEQVKNKTYFNKKKIKVIGSGIDLSNINKYNTAESRKALDLPVDSFIIGLPGRIDPQKGQKLLLSAIKEIKEGNIHILLMGDITKEEGNVYENEIMSIIKINSWEKKVHLRGHQNDMSNFYSSIDCMVMASKSETFGMVTLEAISYGIPVIGSNAGGTPELLGGGKFGYLFESENQSSLGEKIKEAYHNKKELNTRDLSNHLKRFDHNIVCDSIERELSLKSI